MSPPRSLWQRWQGRWLRVLDQIDAMGIIDFDTDEIEDDDIDGFARLDVARGAPVLR